MATITAIYENGVFRPLDPVDLPEGSTVRIEPVVESTTPSATPRTPEEEAHLDRIYEILSRRHHGGDPQATARHDEHQP
ncbi:MAG TPA: antitoxin family protein [Gemmataceae bacterium]|jgi:predicted DNA-binding antitoxin AbrB/MazE fold protein